MKKSDKGSSKKKRTVLAVSAVGVLALIGGVIAYNHDSAFFRNLFHIGGLPGSEEFTEYFESPDKWSCQEVTPKTVQYTNHTGTKRVVRAKYEEYWKESGSTSTTHDTELPLEQNGRKMAIVNVDSEGDWELNDGDGWYYYKYYVNDNDQTTGFMDSVKFNCDLTEAEQYTCTDTAQGKSCESTLSDYHGAKFHVFVTIQTEEANNSSWPVTPEGDDTRKDDLQEIIADEGEVAPPSPNPIDYTREAVDPGDDETVDPNGYGVRTIEGEDGSTIIRYYRGDVRDNHIIFGGFCWRIMRTTATGGIKIVYNGHPNAQNQCLETGEDTQISLTVNNETKNNFIYGYYPQNCLDSPSHVGYMVGGNGPCRRNGSFDEFGDTDDVVFGKSYEVSEDKTRVTLTDTIQTSFWSARRNNQIPNLGYRYYCDSYFTVGSCAIDHLRYLVGGLSTDWLRVPTILSREGMSIDEILADGRENRADSTAKATIESWFEANHLDGSGNAPRNYENYLEDTVFCNDRDYYQGSLYAQATTLPTVNYNWDWTSYHVGYNRNAVLNASNNYSPSLSCAKAGDKFTASDSNGNGKLRHKIGMLTADELTLAGVNWSGNENGSSYLSNGSNILTMTPAFYGGSGTGRTTVFSYKGTKLGTSLVHYDYQTGIKPVVSLKAGTKIIRGGKGTATRPYIVKYND